MRRYSERRNPLELLAHLLGLVAVTLLAFGLAGCDSSSVTAPAVPDAAGPALERQAAGAAAGSKYVVVQGPACAESCEVEAELGAQGGRLRLGNGHQLVVPAGAVSGPTRFRMRAISPAGGIGVELWATDVGTGSDVGESGFRRAVELHLSVQGVEVADRQRLAIAWLRGGLSDLVLMPSRPDPSESHVLALLPHFSGYIIVSN